MSSYQSFMTTMSPGRRGCAPQDELLRTIPAPRGHAAAGTVVLVDLGPSEWALLVPRRGLPALEPALAGLAGPFAPPLPGQFTLVRVPDGIDPALGLAVLHYRRGRTLVYCPTAHIAGDRTARKLSALGGQVIGDATYPEPVLTIAPVEHVLLPASLHPAEVVPPPGGPADLTPGQDIMISVCADMITAELAGVLSVLWTAQARTLARFTPGLGCGEVLRSRG